GAAVHPRGFPARRLSRRRRGLLLPGDRRHHEDPRRHRHEPTPPRTSPSARPAGQLRTRTGHRRPGTHWEQEMTDCGCDKAKAELEEYLHRELSDQDFRDVTEHLENCEDCTNEHTVGLT